MPAPPKRTVSKEGRAAANEVASLLLKVARPMFWHIGVKNNGTPRGATAFVLQFGQRLIGVTADHVIDEYLAALKADERMLCQLGTARIWPERSIVARSKSLDIATFAISQDELINSKTVPLDCSGSNWPPPEIAEGDTISMAGFLDESRDRRGYREYDMSAYGGHGIAESVTPRTIVTVYEPQKVGAPMPGIPLPPLGLNMSGCSGGPVLLMKATAGILRWHIIGLIYQGPKGTAEGELANSDRVFIRRIHFLNSDGTINDPDTGWLPN